jgi:hypothetical protein
LESELPNEAYTRIISLLLVLVILIAAARGRVVVKAVYYKPESHGFENR